MRTNIPVNPLMAKKHNLSSAFVLTIEAIEKLQRSLIYEEDETEEDETGDLEERLANLLSLLKARVGGTKVGTRSVHHPFVAPLLLWRNQRQFGKRQFGKVEHCPRRQRDFSEVRSCTMGHDD